MRKLAKQLIKLGYDQPDLRPHLRPILNKITKTSSFDAKGLVKRLEDSLWITENLLDDLQTFLAEASSMPLEELMEVQAQLLDLLPRRPMYFDVREDEYEKVKEDIRNLFEGKSGIIFGKIRSMMHSGDWTYNDLRRLLLSLPKGQREDFKQYIKRFFFSKKSRPILEDFLDDHLYSDFLGLALTRDLIPYLFEGIKKGMTVGNAWENAVERNLRENYGVELNLGRYKDTHLKGTLTRRDLEPFRKILFEIPGEALEKAISEGSLKKKSRFYRIMNLMPNSYEKRIRAVMKDLNIIALFKAL